MTSSGPTNLPLITAPAAIPEDLSRNLSRYYLASLALRSVISLFLISGLSNFSISEEDAPGVTLSDIFLMFPVKFPTDYRMYFHTYQ